MNFSETYPFLKMLNFESYAQDCTQNGLQFLKPKIIQSQKIEARQCLFLFEKNTSLMAICRSSTIKGTGIYILRE